MVFESDLISYVTEINTYIQIRKHGNSTHFSLTFIYGFCYLDYVSVKSEYGGKRDSFTTFGFSSFQKSKKKKPQKNSKKTE